MRLTRVTGHAKEAVKWTGDVDAAGAVGRSERRQWRVCRSANAATWAPAIGIRGESTEYVKPSITYSIACELDRSSHSTAIYCEFKAPKSKRLEMASLTPFSATRRQYLPSSKPRQQGLIRSIRARPTLVDNLSRHHRPVQHSTQFPDWRENFHGCGNCQLSAERDDAAGGGIAA